MPHPIYKKRCAVSLSQREKIQREGNRHIRNWWGYSFEDEVISLEKRSFNAWDDQFSDQIQGVRIACATLTLAKPTDQKKKNIVKTMHRYFYSLSKRFNRHINVMFGVEPEHTTNEVHIQADIYLLPEEGTTNMDESFFSVCELLWEWGISEVRPYRGGRSAGYSCKKHDGHSQIVKMYCPKTGDCKKRNKGNRHYCKYHRNP